MEIFRLCNHVPDVYVRNSRDFLLLCRLYDCNFGLSKFDTDSIQNLTSTELIRLSLLPLLQTKLGFFTDIDVTDSDLRYVLTAFPYMVKNKGSRKLILQALYCFMKIKHIESTVYVSIVNKDANGKLIYNIDVGVLLNFTDTSILDEIFRYILPTGYTVSYFLYESILEVSEYLQTDLSTIVFVPDYINLQLAGSTDYEIYLSDEGQSSLE